VTFRSRLVIVAAVAVVVAVVAAAAASYLAARNSLLGSVDGTLQASATSTIQTVEEHGGRLPHDGLRGHGYEFISTEGAIITGGGITSTTSAKEVASGTAPSYFATIAINGTSYRELVVHVGTVVYLTGPQYYRARAALELILPLTSVDSQLSRLGSILLIVVVLGIALALLLAWMVGKTALVPLAELTAAVEGVAATTDVSRRLDPGGPDELGRLRRAFNDLLAALEASQQAQRQLVLDAGHELRTPLTSLRTNLEVVRRLEDLDPEEREVLVDDVLTQMNELTTLVGDLSELARGEQRHAESRVLRLDLVVEEAVAVATTHGRPRTVGFHLVSAPTWVLGQRDRLFRAVGNLLDNALKWSPNGGVVEVACFDGVVTVRDHGPGIAPQDLPHVFDRFYRAPSARSLPGSGLGLAIVAQVAHAEHGSVWAGPAPGGGALLRLHIPTVPPPPDGREDGED
jgi:two-component system, OmpR family, sensor histidine kinase MprB